METKTAEIIVKVYAVLAWIGAGFLVLAALGMLFFSSMAGMMGSALGTLETGVTGGVLAGLGVVLAIVLIAFAVLDVFVGLGLWRHQNWARILTIIGAVFGILGILSLNFISFIIGGVTLWLFGFDDTVKGLFTTPAKKKK